MLTKKILEKLENDDLVEYAENLGVDGLKEGMEVDAVIKLILDKQDEVQADIEATKETNETLEKQNEQLKEDSEAGADEALRAENERLQKDVNDLKKKVTSGQSAIEKLSKTKTKNGKVWLIHTSKGSTNLGRKKGKDMGIKSGKFIGPMRAQVSLAMAKEIITTYPTRFRSEEIK